MNWLKRPLLWLVTSAIPVVIAACYGMPYTYARAGTVVDRETGRGINNIKVTCQRADGTIDSSDRTYGEGDFYIGYDECPLILFEDDDLMLNGGEFNTRAVALTEAQRSTEDPEPLRIELDRR